MCRCCRKPAHAGPLAVLAGAAVRALGLLLSHRRGGRLRTLLGEQGVRNRSDEPRVRNYLVCAWAARSTTWSGCPRANDAGPWSSPGTAWRAPGATWTRHRRAPGAQRFRVICPDTIGRGLSQWSPKPAGRLLPRVLLQPHRTSLLDQLNLEQVHWLGTSMGGAIGCVCAAGSLRGRITNAWCSTTSAPRLRRARRSAASAATPATRRRFDTVL